MKRFSFLLGLIVILSGCSDEHTDSKGPGIAYDPSKIVCFTTESATRGTPVTSVSEMTDIGVFCSYTAQSDWNKTSSPLNKMFNRKLTRNASSSVWEYDGAPEPWLEGGAGYNAASRYTFFAYAPFATAANGIVVNGVSGSVGIPILTYTVPSNCADQPDLMVAAPKYNFRPSAQAVRLDMQHALTCVGFQIASTTGGEKLTGIKVSGVSMSGTLALGGEGSEGDLPKWTVDAVNTVTDFSSSLNSDSGETYYTVTTSMTDDLLQGNGYLMMIPQQLRSDAKVTLSFEGEPDRIISLDTHHWEMGRKVVYNITLTPQGAIVVDPDYLLLPFVGANHLTDNIEVICTDLNGNPSSTLPWTLTVTTSESDPNWLTLSINSDGSNAGKVLSGIGSQIIYTFATENTSTTAIRKATINYGAGSINVDQAKEITIPPDGGTLPSGVTTYVGAFWRADQTGERLIRIPVGTNSGNLGPWIATVIFDSSNGFANDDIILDASTPIPTYPVTTDAESHPVAGSQAAVGGDAKSDGHIFFRVGLKTSYTVTVASPARYAIIAINYNNYNKVQLLYLRQGEEADIIGGSAVKWSVYNSQPTTYAPLASQGAIIPVSYPTRTGGYKQFNDATGFFSPGDPRTPSSAWVSNNSATSIGTACPSGYKLPTGDSNASEMYSLQTSGTTSVWGYYADGFFDRGTIATNGSVGSGNDVAYRGRLFVNTITKASLFIPASGYRSNSSGALSYVGDSGFYWSSSPFGTGSGWYLSFGSGIANRLNNYRSYGLGIRCVRDVSVGVKPPTDGGYTTW